MIFDLRASRGRAGPEEQESRKVAIRPQSDLNTTNLHQPTKSALGSSDSCDSGGSPLPGQAIRELAQVLRAVLLQEAELPAAEDSGRALQRVDGLEELLLRRPKASGESSTEAAEGEL